MNNDRGNTELTVNVPKNADYETFKAIIHQRTNSKTEEQLQELYAHFNELNEKEEKERKELIAIIGDLYDKYVGKTDYESQKKMREINDVACYLLNTGKESRIVAEGESPDFIVEIEGESTGLEHTVYINDEAVAKISTIQSVFSAIEKEILEKNPEAKLLLNVGIDLEHLPNKNYLRTACYEYFTSLVNNTEIDRPMFIKSLIVSPHETFQIKYNEDCKPTPIDIDHFEKKLDAKNSKIENYKAKSGLNKINLLMIIDGIGCKSNFYIDLAKMPKKERAFSEIIIYNRFEKTILVGKIS